MRFRDRVRSIPRILWSLPAVIPDLWTLTTEMQARVQALEDISKARQQKFDVVLQNEVKVNESRINELRVDLEEVRSPLKEFTLQFPEILARFDSALQNLDHLHTRLQRVEKHLTLNSPQDPPEPDTPTEEKVPPEPDALPIEETT